MKTRANVRLRRLTPRIWYLPARSWADRPTLGIVAGERATLVVDSGNSAAHANQLLAQLAANGLRPPDLVALTHWHWDHVLGAAHLPGKVWASRETDAMLRTMAEWDWSDAGLDARVRAGVEIAFCRSRIRRELPAPRTVAIRTADRVIDEAVEIDLGGLAARLVPVGGDHSPDAIVVFVPEEKTLFLSDCLYPDLYHGPQHFHRANLLALLDRLEVFDADAYFWGHDRAPMTGEAFRRFVGVCRTVASGGDVPGDEDAAWLKPLLR